MAATGRREAAGTESGVQADSPVTSSLARAAVDALAQQIRVPAVARVLLDHVDDDAARFPGLARHEGLAQVVVADPRLSTALILPKPPGGPAVIGGTL